MRPGDERPPCPPYCHIPVGRSRGDPGPREGVLCRPLRSCPDPGLDSGAGGLIDPLRPPPDTEAHKGTGHGWVGHALWGFWGRALPGRSRCLPRIGGSGEGGSPSGRGFLGHLVFGWAPSPRSRHTPPPPGFLPETQRLLHLPALPCLAPAPATLPAPPSFQRGLCGLGVGGRDSR